MLLRLTENDRSKLEDLAECADLSLHSAAIRSIRSGLKIESRRFNLSPEAIVDLAAETPAALPDSAYEQEDASDE